MIAACGGSGNSDFDASPPDSDPSCGEWTVAPTAGANLRVFDPLPGPIALGRTIRIAYDVDLTDCEQPAAGSVTAEPGETAGTISPQVLRQIGGTCSGTAHAFTRVLDFVPQTAGSWTVTLGADDVTFDVDPEPAPACDPLRTPCQSDCDCDAATGERCLGVTQGVPTTACARPCELDRDCGGTGRCTGDAPGATPYTCDARPECDGATPCPVGFTCTGGACTPTFTLSQTTRHECGCDADCDTGLRCVRPVDTSQPNRCQAMCLTDGPWCEGAHFCGTPWTDVSGLAGTDAVCVWAGE